ncbi:Cloroperoxidase [Thelephora terrestris]|uniref:Cloroperoxidase n=1 Tax=Thelephora terrestris TaxID=56493 RepID=A0A9P6H6I8_9AGAM|nr:Cloroperoxidase [Thelephora terrestris]
MSSNSTSTSTSHPFIVPNPSDLRSPCPALNALANHGYINRDGRNITVHALVEAMHEVYSLTKPLAYLLALAGVLLCGDGRTVDLHRLAKHNVIEHDASLSRQDTQPPNVYAPICADPILVSKLMRVSQNDFLVLSDLAVTRVIRESEALGGPLNPLRAEVGRAESALILQVFGGERLEVDKSVLCVWLVDGRLPESWQSPRGTVGIRTTVSVGRRIADVMDSIRNRERGRPSPLGPYHLTLFPLSRVLRSLMFGLTS